MKVYSFDYDFTYVPSAPVVEIKVTNGPSKPSISLIAFIDTGADATMIPFSVLDQLDAEPVDTRYLRTVTGMRSEVDLYPVTIQIGPFTFPNLKVVATRLATEIIVGRDVLKHLVVTLNGLASVTEISQ